MSKEFYQFLFFPMIIHVNLFEALWGECTLLVVMLFSYFQEKLIQKGFTPKANLFPGKFKQTFSNVFSNTSHVLREIIIWYV